MKTLLITDSDFAATDKNFEYLLGFQPSLGAMIVGKTKISIFLDARYFENTKTIDELSLKKKLGSLEFIIDYIQIKTDFIELLAEKIGSKKEINFSNNIALKYYEGLQSILVNTKINIVENIFSTKRIIKTSAEIKHLSKAIEIIDEVFEHITKLNTAGEIIGKTEAQVRGIIISKIMELGGSGESFDTIVGFGSNSAIPHHSAGETIIGNGVVLIDMGALYKGYCSDFSRTFWVGEETEQFEEFQKVYNIVKESHLKAFENTQIGMVSGDVDRFAREHIESTGYGEFFIHSTGHGIGLDVHELPWISKNKENMLENGMVFTIEPGIYLPGKFGVRLEDIVFMKNGKLEKASKIAL